MRAKEEKTYVQCQCCGHLYQSWKKISIEESIIESECPACGYKRGLNCGTEDEIYLYMNPNLDKKYYEY